MFYNIISEKVIKIFVDTTCLKVIENPLEVLLWYIWYAREQLKFSYKGNNSEEFVCLLKYYGVFLGIITFLTNKR